MNQNVIEYFIVTYFSQKSNSKFVRLLGEKGYKFNIHEELLFF